jgi:hypothetical protein
MNAKIAAVVVALVLIATVLFATFYRYDVEVSGNAVSSRGLMFSDSVVSYQMRSIVYDPNESGMDIGIALDTDKLDFGRIAAGSTGYTRTINIANNEQVPAKISFTAEGDIAPYIQLEDNGFVMQGGDARSIRIRMGSDRPGNYTGTLYISARKANQGWLEWITPWA